MFVCVRVYMYVNVKNHNGFDKEKTWSFYFNFTQILTLVILVHNIMSESWKWEEAWCFQKLQTQDHNQNNQKGDLDKAKLDIFL